MRLRPHFASIGAELESLTRRSSRCSSLSRLLLSLLQVHRFMRGRTRRKRKERLTAGRRSQSVTRLEIQANKVRKYPPTNSNNHLQSHVQSCQRLRVLFLPRTAVLWLGRPPAATPRTTTLLTIRFSLRSRSSFISTLSANHRAPTGGGGEQPNR